MNTAAGGLRDGQRPRGLIEAIAAYLEQHKDVQPQVTRKAFEKGDFLIESGRAPQYVYVVVQGNVTIVAADADGENVTKIRDVHAPTVLGEIGVETGKATADAVAQDHVEVLAIPAIVYRQMLTSCEPIREATRTLLAKRIGDLTSMERTEPLGATTSDSLDRFAEQGDSDVRQVLKSLAKQSRTHRERITLFRKKSFVPNEIMFQEDREGVSSKEMYIILQGEVRMDKWSREARASVYTGRRGVGEMVGEDTLLDRHKGRTSTVQAITPVEAVIVRQEVLEELLATDKDFAAALQRMGKQQRAGRREAQARVTAERDETPSEVFGASKDALLPDLTKRLGQTTSSTELFGAISAFNASEKLLPGSAWTIVHRTNKGVVTFDYTGKLYFQELTKDNARHVLALVKLRTEGANKAPDNTNGYQMRQECVRRDPTIPTHEAFIWGPPPPMSEADFRKTITTKLNWLPQRLALHEKLENEALDEARKLSDRIQTQLETLGVQRPTLIMMKGNTGAGKSTTVRTQLDGVPNFGIIDEAGGTSGVINPDELKNPLRSDAKLDGQHTVTHNQVFSEGAARGFSVISRIMKEKLNMVVDKRFCTVREVDGVVKEAKQNGYKSIVVIDVDADGETSLNRVYGDEEGMGGRNPDGDDPIVPVDAITQGFRDTRGERGKVIEYLMKEKSGEGGMQAQYYLFKTDYATPTPGKRLPPKLVATMNKDTASVSPAPNEGERFADLTAAVPDDEMKRLNGLLVARAARRAAAATTV